MLLEEERVFVLKVEEPSGRRRPVLIEVVDHFLPPLNW
jgi:hypothetical protein